MKVLVVAATEMEISPTLPVLRENDIMYTITGVGMVATAYQLGKILASKKFDLIINVGIAGSFSKDIPLGTVVHVVTDHLSELGAEDHGLFLTMEELGLGISSWNNTSATVESSLMRVEGITVNTVHGNSSSIAAIVKRFPNMISESMEGAAVFYAASQAKIPCIQVRSISNYVEPRDKSTWNIPLAIQNINIWLTNFLHNSNLTDGVR